MDAFSRRIIGFGVEPAHIDGTFCFFKAGQAPDGAFAISKLATLRLGHIDFRVIPMQDGNYLVGFGDPIFGLLLKDEADALACVADKNLEVGMQVKAALHRDVQQRVVSLEVSNA